MADIQTLVQLQQNDTEKLRLERELQELPEAAQIMECRAKRKELKGRQDQVVELSDDVDAKLDALRKEEEQVIAKINELQTTLDTTSDYRVTQSVTRDMEGQVKRQGSIAEEQDALLERQIKIDNLADQLAGMLAEVDHREEHLTGDFKEKGGKLKGQIDALAAKHAELIGLIDPATAKRYEQLRKEKGGIAVGRLDGETCSACRTTIMTGQLSKLKKGPDLGECPNCHRMLVVRDDEEG